MDLYIPVEEGGLDGGLDGVPLTVPLRFSSELSTLVLLFHDGRPTRDGGMLLGANDVRDFPNVDVEGVPAYDFMFPPFESSGLKTRGEGSGVTLWLYL